MAPLESKKRELYRDWLEMTDKVIPFPVKTPLKFGFERVKKLRREKSTREDQTSSGQGRVLQLPSLLSPFEEALLLDERQDRQAES